MSNLPDARPRVTTDPDPLLSVTEVRARLGGVSKRTIYNWIHKGYLPPPHKIGAQSMWRTSEIEAAKDARRGLLKKGVA